MKEGTKMVKLELVAKAVTHHMPAIFMYHALLEAGGWHGLKGKERQVLTRSLLSQASGHRGNLSQDVVYCTLSWVWKQ